MSHDLSSLLHQLIGLCLQLVSSDILVLHHLFNLLDLRLRFLVHFLTLLDLHLILLFRCCISGGISTLLRLARIKLVRKHLTLVEEIGLLQCLLLFSFVYFGAGILLRLARRVQFVEFIGRYFLLGLLPLCLLILVLLLVLRLITSTILTLRLLCLR